MDAIEARVTGREKGQVVGLPLVFMALRLLESAAAVASTAWTLPPGYRLNWGSR
jgi:hypothetical protein